MSEPTRAMFTKSLFEKFGTVVTKSEIYLKSPQKCISSDMIANNSHFQYFLINRGPVAKRLKKLLKYEL
jgi:hypothetical protein